MRLGSVAFPALLRRDDIHLVMALGATEQHGPHLPLDTDTRIAMGIADVVARDRRDIAVAPALPYGSSGEHAGFPGTLSLSQAALEAVVVELIRSADAFADTTLLAWHGGNVVPLARAVRRLRAEGRPVRVWAPRLTSGDAHAGRVETSLMLALAPELVGSERPVGATQPLHRLRARLRRDGVQAVSANGVLGDARGASAQEGRELLRRFAGEVRELIGVPAGDPAPA